MADATTELASLVGWTIESVVEHEQESKSHFATITLLRIGERRAVELHGTDLGIWICDAPDLVADDSGHRNTRRMPDLRHVLERMDDGSLGFHVEGAGFEPGAHMDIVFVADNGWRIIVFIDGGTWDYIDRIELVDGTVLDYDDLSDDVRRWSPHHPERWGIVQHRSIASEIYAGVVTVALATPWVLALLYGTIRSNLARGCRRG